MWEMGQFSGAGVRCVAIDLACIPLSAVLSSDSDGNGLYGANNRSRWSGCWFGMCRSTSSLPSDPNTPIDTTSQLHCLLLAQVLTAPTRRTRVPRWLSTANGKGTSILSMWQNVPIVWQLVPSTPSENNALDSPRSISRNLPSAEQLDCSQWSIHGFGCLIAQWLSYMGVLVVSVGQCEMGRAAPFDPLLNRRIQSVVRPFLVSLALVA